MNKVDIVLEAARQAYVAFGIAIAAAATGQIDATPMEGFRKLNISNLLQTKSKFKH